jgi:hypothetical protein
MRGAKRWAGRYNLIYITRSIVGAAKQRTTPFCVLALRPVGVSATFRFWGIIA